MQILLYELRKKSKLTQKEMADELGISRQNYGKKERSELPFDQDEMFRISEYFNKDIDEIFLPRTYRFGNKQKA